MNTPIRHVFVTLIFLIFAMSAWAQSPTMEHGEAIYHDTSPPLSDMAAAAVRAAADGEVREVPLRTRPDFGRDPNDAAPDGDMARESLLRSSIASLGPTPAPGLSAEGLSSDDNFSVFGFRLVPPDTNGDIGFDHLGNKIYVQYINVIWGVFDATTGAMTAGPFPGNSFWAGFGGFCEANNDGDSIVLYDDQAGRWLFSEFSVSEGIQCVAVSTTSDPLGPYHRYAFVVTPGGANDYPKFGVWHDTGGQSAYTFTTRDFGGPGGPFSVGAGVMERDAMLAGNPAQFLKFINPCVDGDCIEGQLPPHQAGPLPPAGTCPTFWTAVDAAYDDSPHNNDGYRNHTLCVDWTSIFLSTYTEGPFVVAGSNFDRFLGNGLSDCISPVKDGEALDCLAAFTMYRAQYRWFGTNARVVLNTTVDAGGERAGIRWAEVRSADGDSGWFLQQDGTYAPADGIERWMGSIAQDQSGNIALGYSAASGDLFPSVRYTSRTGGDPLGTMPGGEVFCHEGTGAQTASGGRWGDYSSMSIDPEDDCTFWYTQEYYETTGSFDWKTRMCSFAFPDCGVACTPTEPGTELTCSDGLDNDCDGDYDCTDADCAADAACVCVPSVEICTDGIDNDCDGFTDCDDDSCTTDPACGGPPANDLCTNAQEIQCGDVVTGSTTNATFDDVGFCGTSNTAPGVWYKLTDALGLVTASTCNAADFDTKLTAFDGTCSELGCIAGRDDTAGCAGFTTELNWAATAPEQLILVHGFGSATGTFSLTVSCTPPAENDDCDGAIGPLAVGSVTSGSTTNATLDEPPSIDCGTSVTAPGVWYTVEGTGNTMTASTCNDGDPATGAANYDTKISVYCADCETKECVGGQDDNFGAGCAGFTTKFSWPTQAGRTYKVLVHGFSSQTGDFDLAILDDGVPVPPGEANDCDGIPAGFDFCPGTAIPESVPTKHLKPTHWAVGEDGEFYSILPPGMAEFPHMYSIEDTAGCSCEQIIDELSLGGGHTRFGCASSAMQEWVAYLESQSCGNCVESRVEPGCENGACEAAICAIDPFCCNVFWDGICVAEALDFCVPDLCIALPLSSEVPAFYGEGRSPESESEPISKDPDFVPKE